MNEPVRRKAGITALAAAMALLALPMTARATLGEAAESVERDRAQFHARVAVRPQARYSVHELALGANVLVREFVDSSGRVFAVTWSGQSRPDLHQLLGSYHAQLAQAPVSTVRRRGPVVLHQGNIVFESGGHMRALHGRAYLTDALPAGVSVDEIR